MTNFSSVAESVKEVVVLVTVPPSLRWQVTVGKTEACSLRRVASDTIPKVNSSLYFFATSEKAF